MSDTFSPTELVEELREYLECDVQLDIKTKDYNLYESVSLLEVSDTAICVLWLSEVKAREIEFMIPIRQIESICIS